MIYAIIATLQNSTLSKIIFFGKIQFLKISLVLISAMYAMIAPTLRFNSFEDCVVLFSFPRIG